MIYISYYTYTQTLNRLTGNNVDTTFGDQLRSMKQLTELYLMGVSNNNRPDLKNITEWIRDFGPVSALQKGGRPYSYINMKIRLRIARCLHWETIEAIEAKFADNGILFCVSFICIVFTCFDLYICYRDL